MIYFYVLSPCAHSVFCPTVAFGQKLVKLAILSPLQEFTSQNNLTVVQCRYQAPDSCNQSFTPTACCGRGAASALVMNFLFLVAMVAIAGQII